MPPLVWSMFQSIPEKKCDHRLCIEISFACQRNSKILGELLHLNHLFPRAISISSLFKYLEALILIRNATFRTFAIKTDSYDTHTYGSKFCGQISQQCVKKMSSIPARMHDFWRYLHSMASSIIKLWCLVYQYYHIHSPVRFFFKRRNLY